MKKKARKKAFLALIPIIIVLYLLGFFIADFINGAIYEKRLASDARWIARMITPPPNQMNNDVLEKAFAELRKRGIEINYGGWQAIDNPNPVYPGASVTPDDYSILVFNSNKTRAGFVAIRSDLSIQFLDKIPTSAEESRVPDEKKTRLIMEPRALLRGLSLLILFFEHNKD